MIFGTAQHWATDSLQWKLDAERTADPKWDVVLPIKASHEEPIFCTPIRTLQLVLDQELSMAS
jgi:hypothetical protein